MSEYNNYKLELAALAESYEAAVAADITSLRNAISGASESSIIGVGSGGSFTIASLLCNLHETYTGRVSRPSTPLELICNPTLASASPVFLVSAEGKNPDIIEALLRARHHSARAIHIITNREDSPLTTRIAGLTDITKHVFPLAKKDGYLATNSLLLDAVLVARAYGELDNATNNFPARIEQLRIGEQTIGDWISHTREFAQSVAQRGCIIVTYSPLLRAIAADLESKLSEAALAHCQLADLRSFAHGRHLWLAERPHDCTVLALVEPSLEKLWDSTANHFPEGIPKVAMKLRGAMPPDLLAGLVAQMHLVSEISGFLGRDPAKPTVPQFGRDLYYLNLEQVIPPPDEPADRGELSKYDVIGARWPSKLKHGTLTRALEKSRSSLENQMFRAIVFDYDGTICASQRKDSPPPAQIVDKICSLAHQGIIIGIASGRGGSIKEHMQNSLPKDVWPSVLLGLYNGGFITHLGGDDPVDSPMQTSEFLSHVTRLIRRLKTLGVPIERLKPNHPFQVSVRFKEGIATEKMWFVVADTLRQAGLDVSRIVRSKHSIDILAPGVNKARLIAHVIHTHSVEPYQILTIGDQGAWPGNDFSLLEHRYSLSVDMPSRRMDRGWKMAPPHKRDVDATLWYLEHIKTTESGEFTISINE